MTYDPPVVDITAYKEDSLRAYSIEMKWRKLPRPIRLSGEMVSRYKAPHVTEYLEQATGEIVKASRLRHDPLIPPQIHVGEIILLRQALMETLHKKVRAFAMFVLEFRNNRRGVTPEIDTLVEWYAFMHDKRPSNVRRYVEILQDAGFLAGASLLSPLFQRTGKNKTTKDHLGEDVVARERFLAMRLKSLNLWDRQNDRKANIVGVVERRPYATG